MARRKRKNINDGLQSLSLNLGKKQDALNYTASLLKTDQKRELSAMWARKWLINKVCGKKADDMTRKWRDVTTKSLTPDEIDAFDDLERALKVKQVLKDAAMWASFYGGVAILVVTNSPVEAPLSTGQEIKKLQIIEPSKIEGVGDRNSDVTSDNFNKYDFYNVRGEMGAGVKVHYSRLIIVNAVARELEDHNHIFGISDIEGVYDEFKRLDSTSLNAADIVLESKTDIFKMRGLTNQLATSDGTNKVAGMIGAIQAIKSSTNSLLIDAENEYDQKELGFGGLTDLIREFRIAVAAAADMPLTVLFGQSAAGFSTGEEDIENYHASIHSLQEARLRPVLEILDPILCYQSIGKYPEDWRFEFNPLRQVSKAEKVATLTAFAQAADILIRNGVLTEAQAAAELLQLELINSITDDDIELLKELESYDYQSQGITERTQQGEKAAGIETINGEI